jgi:hypothetical protein
MSDLHVRIEDALTRVQKLNYLCAWISRARHLTECIASLAEDEPTLTLARALEGIPIHDASWDMPEKDGLDYLNLTITLLLDDMRREVDAEFELVQAARGSGNDPWAWERPA